MPVAYVKSQQKKQPRFLDCLVVIFWLLLLHFVKHVSGYFPLSFYFLENK